MKREELKTLDLLCDMGVDVNGNRNLQPWKAYDIDEVNLLIDELESQLPKWISVEDVLPQWGKLVKIKFKDGKEDERRFSADYKWVSKGMQTCESVNVTHWMPLPPQPTIEEK